MLSFTHQLYLMFINLTDITHTRMMNTKIQNITFSLTLMALLIVGGGVLFGATFVHAQGTYFDDFDAGATYFDDYGADSTYYDDYASAGGTHFDDYDYTGGTYFDDYDAGGTYYDDYSYVGGTYYDDYVGGTYYDDYYPYTGGTYYDDYYNPDYYGYSYDYSYPSYSPSYSYGYGTPSLYTTTKTIGYPVTIGSPSRTTVSSPSRTTVTTVPTRQQTVQYQYAYAPTCSITATQSAGQGSILSWTSQNGTSAYLTNNGTVGLSGSLSVNPSNVTIYTLTVYNSQGTSGNCQTTVYQTVNQAPSCQIQSSLASNNSMAYLSWTSLNATSATLTNVGSVAANGSHTVYPSGTTTYTLTVYNANGQSYNCQTTVVGGTTYNSNTPSCSITISTPSNQYGYSNGYYGQSTLSWVSSYASSAYISPSVGVVSPGSGSATVYPSSGTYYTMTVYGPNGQNTCQTQVNYPTYQSLSCSLTASPSTIQNGGSSNLSWTSFGASSASLSDGLGNVSTNGSLSVRPETSRNYTLTVRDTYGRTNTCNAWVSTSGSYISLSQVPYTGFDFGPFGNTVYWMTLLALAGGAAYFVLFYRGGALNIARETFSMLAPMGAYPMQEKKYEAEMNIPTRDVRVSVLDLPVRQSEPARATKDAMSVIHSKAGEAPRIVITRT